MMDGIAVLDKPRGISSFQVVSKAKRALGVRKIGHTGTLDPAATGLLILCVGRATRLARFITQGDKVYEGTITLGVETDSYDAEGRIIATRTVPDDLGHESIIEAVKGLTGTIWQAPPPFSAAKHKGVPLYKLARKGITVKKQKRRVNIFSFDIIGIEMPQIHFRINCSKGTYIRSLAHELGQTLGTGAILSELRRIRTGHITLEHATDLDTFCKKADAGQYEQLLISVEQATSHVPCIFVNNRDAMMLIQGQGLGIAVLREYIAEQAPVYFRARPEVLRIMTRINSQEQMLVGFVAWPSLSGGEMEQVEVLRNWASAKDLVAVHAGQVASCSGISFR